MQVVWRSGDVERDVEIPLLDHAAVVADLATTLGHDDGPLLVAGRQVAPDTPLTEAGLRNGVVLAHVAEGPAPETRPPLVALARIGGTGPAEVIELGAGWFDIVTEADGQRQFTVAVDRHGAVVIHPRPGETVLLDGEAVASPTAVDDAVIDVWGHAFRCIEPARAGRRLGGADLGGRLPFARAPRQQVPEPDGKVIQPDLASPPAPPQPLSWITMLAPLPIGVLMAFLFNPLFLAFTLMSPVMLFGRWAEGRYRGRKNSRRHQIDLTEARAEFGHRLDAARRAHAAWLWATRPGAAELAARADAADARLWERRPHHDDFLDLPLGMADDLWEPEFEPLELRAEFLTQAEAAERLPSVPVTASLTDGGALGIAGCRARVLDAGRAAVLAAVLQSGPADVRLHLLVEPERLADWDWLKWLPHLTDDNGRRRVAVDVDDGARLLRSLGPSQDERPAPLGVGPARGPVALLVIDGPSHLEGRTSLARRLLADPRAACRGIVIAERADDLPAVCTTVLELGERDATVVVPDTGAVRHNVLACGVTSVAVAEAARAVACFDDPDMATSSSLPASVDLLALLDLGNPLSGAAVASRWAAAGTDPRPSVVVGVGEHGPQAIDLVGDGPHGLVAGTTGSGKSELLRTWVASLSCAVDPEHLNFILVDFKGGGAFDVCEDLPHTVAVVTDLDEHLSARALRCLAAELRYREVVLRAAGVSDLPHYLAAAPAEPLPRLVVVIDEFATLAAELPDFLDALVDIAQRGRSLGIHVVLATQRPAGVLDQKVRANTNLRIALRVQDDHDSLDVLGTAAAAGLGRRQAGRGFIRRGAGDIVAFQTALVTGRSEASSSATVGVPREFELRPPEVEDVFVATADLAPGAAANGPTDLERIVAAVTDAATTTGMRRPRVPWPEPLPARLPAERFHGLESGRRWATPLGLVDLPDEQRQDVHWFDAAEGSLVVYGVEATDTTATLATVVLGLAGRHDPGLCHIYVLDHGSGALTPLGDLPHCGAHIRGDDEERTVRLLDFLDAELDRRRRLLAGQRLVRLGPGVVDGDHEVPLIAVLVDNYAAFAESFEEARRPDIPPRLAQIIRDGPGLGVVVVATSTTDRGIPSRVANQVEQKLLHRFADPNSYATFGLRPKDVPHLGPGRALVATTEREVQIGWFANGDIGEGVRAVPDAAGSGHRPATVEVLGDEVPLHALDGVGEVGTTWHLPIGLRSADLGPATLTLGAGDHAIVAGAGGSGRSTTLASIATVARRLAAGLVIVAITPRPSPLRGHEAPSVRIDDEASIADELAAVTGPALVLVDDAERLGESSGQAIAALAQQQDDDVHIVVAARSDTFRGFGHWTQVMREARSGIVLQPAPQDGDLFKTQLPLRAPTAFPVGRGFLVEAGVPELVQVAAG